VIERTSTGSGTETSGDSTHFATLLAYAPTSHVTTVYSLLGDWFAWFVLVLLVLVLTLCTGQLTLRRLP